MAAAVAANWPQTGRLNHTTARSINQQFVLGQEIYTNDWAGNGGTPESTCKAPAAERKRALHLATRRYMTAVRAQQLTRGRLRRPTVRKNPHRHTGVN
jgi:hypothetical protein